MGHGPTHGAPLPTTVPLLPHVLIPPLPTLCPSTSSPPPPNSAPDADTDFRSAFADLQKRMFEFMRSQFEALLAKICDNSRRLDTLSQLLPVYDGSR